LHAVGPPFSGVFSQLPVVFAFGLTQDTLQISEHSAARLSTSKAWGNPGMQMHKLLRPTADISGRRLGSMEGEMLGMLHGLLLSSEVAEVGCSTHSLPHERKEVLKRFSFFGQSATVQLRKYGCSVFNPCDRCVMGKRTIVMAL
jgi:hypothetical protein